ncbi:MAG: hypothetical protein WD652_05610 [Acidimicrobiia bacterium]
MIVEVDESAVDLTGGALSGRVAAMQAPTFTLEDQAGRPFSLGDHLDAAVVLFFLRGDW